MDVDPIADSPERAELRATVRRLVAEVAAAGAGHARSTRPSSSTRTCSSPSPTWARSRSARPPAAGGSGDVRDQLVVVEELAAGPDVDGRVR